MSAQKETTSINNTSSQTRVACIGDSITELTNYPHQLAVLLGKNYTVGNFGVCGSKVSLDSDSPYLYSEACKGAANFQPNKVVIMLGTNDADPELEQFRGNFVEDYLMLVERFQALECKPLIWIATPPPIFSDWMGLSAELLAQEIVPAITEAATRKNLPIVDVYSALHNPRFFTDGVHPNEKGEKLIAEVVYQTLVR